MDIQLSGKHIDLGEALSNHVKDSIEESVTKYSANPVSAQIVFSKDGFEYRCDVTAHLSTGLTAKAKGRANEIYAAADDAVDRIEKQLRRYKRRLKNHHNEKNTPFEAFAEKTYIVEAPTDDSSNDIADNPIIIAENEMSVLSLSVGDAVMQMELAEESMLVFRNVSHGGVNVVYRRQDGNIGWIDPRRN